MKCGRESREARNSQNIQDKLYNRKILPVDGWYHAQKQWSGTNPARFNLTHEGDYKQCSSFKSSLFHSPAFLSILFCRPCAPLPRPRHYCSACHDPGWFPFKKNRATAADSLNLCGHSGIFHRTRPDRRRFMYGTVSTMPRTKNNFRTRPRWPSFSTTNASLGLERFRCDFHDDVCDKSCTDGTRSRAVFGSWQLLSRRKRAEQPSIINNAKYETFSATRKRLLRDFLTT